MLSFFLFLCFVLHTKHKWSKIHPNIAIPVETCQSITDIIKNPDQDNWWMNPNGDKDYLIKCVGTTSSKITLNGPGIFQVRTNIINKLPNGLIDIRNADLDCTMSNIYSSGALSDTVQIMHIQGPGTHSITGTLFNFCGINPYWYIYYNETLPDNWDPSLIYIESDSNSINNFFNVAFRHPKTGSKQIWELCPTRPIRIEGDCSLKFTGGNNEDFYNSSCYSKGSFLWLATKRNVSFSNCNFQECFSTINQCHAVWITEESDDHVTFDNCNFLDCGKNNKGYIIQAEVSGLIFTNNNISFSSSNTSGCIRCKEKGEYIFQNNYFSNAEESSYIWQGVAIDYQGIDNGHTKSENLVFNGNTFDNIKGNNEGRCLSAEIMEGKFTVLEYNYIQNCPAGSFFIKIMQRSDILEFHINKWKFINNTVSDNYGGGAGIWIENNIKDNTYTVPYNLTLNDCEFENNYCLKKGGAFQIGSNEDNNNRDKYVTLVQVNILGCIFTNNTALQGGGAIAIQTNLPLTISGCQFINNKSPVAGGVIYIKTEVTDPSGNNQQMPSATINNCIFRGNSGREAHCIYILDGPRTTIDISNCNFYNNYDENYKSGSCILSNAFQLTASYCNFINDDVEHSCGGINITSCSILEVKNSKFIHCTAGNIDRSYGGGIGYADLSGSHSRDESITINQCLFDGCDGNNGIAIGLKPYTYPIISNIQIKNHFMTKWIFFIFFQFETDQNGGLFELDNIEFINNSYDSASGSEFGGGTGIWIAESEDLAYDVAFNLKFNKCIFSYNYSPENGGAFSYGGSPRLQSIELTFDHCTFSHNRCDHYYGGACRIETNQPVNFSNCHFTNNTAMRYSTTGGSGGGSIFIGQSVESVYISQSTFSDCFAHRGSFIFTNGAMKNINITKCSFSNLKKSHENSVYILVDSQITNFVFDSNIFDGLQCNGEDGGAGLHISNGADCVISNCKFNNCAGKDDESGVIKIKSQIESNSYLIFNSCEFNNTNGIGNEGERPIYIAEESFVQFISCLFLSYNKGNYDGTILYSKSKSSTIFFNCSFNGLKGKCLLHMEEAESADIFDCQFSGCDVDDSLIHANNALNFTVSNNLFSNVNDPIRFGNLVVNGLISNNTFRQCSTKHGNGGALFVDGSSLTIEIKDNLFTKCTANKGLAIYITNDVFQADIHDCSFVDNYLQNGFAYTILSFAKNLRFTDSIIQYNDDEFQGCGLKIEAPCSSEIYNVEFKNIHRPSCLCYDIKEESNKQTIVSNCSFVGFRPKGSSLSGTFYSAFQFGKGLNIEFYNNTISDHQNAGNGWSNLIIGLIDHRIENCTFKSNRVDGQIGGGSGLDFISDEIQIINCIFMQNEVKLNANYEGGTGGAIQFSKNKNRRIEIDNCSFINNRADCEGGALSIGCISSYIHDSTFTRNYAAQQNFGNSSSNYKMGGAIYFNSNDKNEKHTLSNCFFKQNSADQNGHALYIEGSNTVVYASDLCCFEDNSRTNGGSQIFINENAYFDFSNSTVCLKNISSKSRGIELSSGTLKAHDTVFSNIEASKQNQKTEGNAILVNGGDDVINDVSIEDNLFKDCYINDQNSFAVTFNGKQLNFYRNTFDFSPNKGCGCLRIYTTGKINIENNTFQNACTPREFHGIFMYEEKERITNQYHTVIKFNTFQYLTGIQTACFQFKWLSQDYEFIDNTFQHNDLINYLGEFNFMGKKNNGTFYCGRNHFINNTGRSYYGGGTGLWFQNKEGRENLIDNHFTIIIDGCKFIGNHAVENATDKSRGYTNGNGGAIQFGWTESMSNIDVEIRNSTFINNIADRQGGALSIQIIGYSIIENCTFEGNIAGQDSSDHEQVLGGAIYTWPDFNWAKGHYSTNGGNWFYSENMTITDSKFINNKAKEAAAVFFESSEHTDFYIIDSDFIDNYNPEKSCFAIIPESKEFVFENSKIEFTDILKSSSGIRTASITTTIIKSYFLKNCIHDKNNAEAIFAEPDSNEIEIADSVFEDCGRDGNDYSVVKIFSRIANIHNTVFNFTSNHESKSCCAFYIKEFCDIIFYENRITNSNCNGAFQYLPESGDIKNENVLIEKCIFEKCQGKNSRALNVKLSTENISFKNNTIQDCPLSGMTKNGGYLFVFLISQSSISEFIIDKIIFRNLTTDSDFGGGCGAWIQSTKKFTLLFKDCIFEDNYAKNNKKVTKGCKNGKGGALQYGWTDSISNINLNIEGCQFIRNKADLEGGALCLMIEGQITISECKFINNNANINDEKGKYCGGAIAILPEFDYIHKTSTETILIDECTFIGNDAFDANAIFVDFAPKTDLVITNNCNFIDNTNELTNHATVMTETRKLEVDDSVFNFTSLSKSCNAITTNSTTVVLEGTQFYRCTVPKNKQGSALVLKESTKSSIVNGCKFIDNGNNNLGSVIYTEASSFTLLYSEIRFTNLNASDRGIYIPFVCKFYISDSYFYHCKISQNSNGASFYYEGKRRTSHTEDISLENIHFNNNSCTYASCFYMKPSTIPKLKNLTVENHHTGNFGIVIIFQSNIREDILIEKCTFDNNVRKLSSERIPDCGGSGLWIACANKSSGYLESYRLIFSKCTFKNNNNNYCGGAFSYGYSPTLRYIFLDFNDCIFANNTCDGEMGGALSFNGQVPVTIVKTLFTGNKCNSDNYKGHCIYIHQRCRATINDCTFIDNGIFGHKGNHNDSTCGHSIIQCSGTQLDLNNCVMNFTDPNITNSRFIDIDYYSVVNLKFTTFANCNAGDLWGGAIHMNKVVSSIIDEQISIDSCIFDNVKAANGCAALLNTTGVPNLNNLTFMNTNNGIYIFAVFFIAFRDSCSVENTVFENCTAAKEDGGGSAIWIANQEHISHGRPFELVFNNCTWRNNHANKRGGAIHYGNSKTLKGVQMTFEKCHFEGNHAKEEGGAVSLVTRSPITFSDCVFKNNFVDNSNTKESTTTTKGGSISVNSKTPLVSITGCSFNNETSSDGNAIYIHSTVQACIISSSSFSNCGTKGTVIISETIEFMLLNSEIKFDKRYQSSRALEIKTISFTTISFCKFTKCHSIDVGGAIYLNNTLMSEEQEEFTLEDSIFDACESNLDGCAFYLNVSSSPVLRKITFMNHQYDKNMSVIINNYDFQNIYTIESCTFKDNKFENTKEQDGGGSAIFIANGIKSVYESSYKISFVGSTWSGNNAAYGGAFSSGTNLYHLDTELVFERCTFTNNIATKNKGGALYLKTTQQIYFDECTFTNNKCHNPDSPKEMNGGAIYIVSCQLVTLSHSIFTGNYANDGHAIWIEDNPLFEANYCTFTSNNDGRLGSQISSKCEQLIFRDSTIEFNERKPQSRGIHIKKNCMINFNNCQFLNCNITENGGGILITNDSPLVNRTESLTLSDCIFDKCDSSNGAAIQGTISCNPTIQRCTISNCNGGRYIISLFFNKIQEFVSVDDCTFIGNYFSGTSTSDSGGIGLWIAHEKGMSVDKFTLSFNRCFFISNSANKNGGAFAYGESLTLKNISLKFSRCVFNGNSCNGGMGGALYISVNQQITISDCDFQENKCNGANSKGSAIYLNSPSEIVSIRDCTFTGGLSINGAVYSTSTVKNLAISGSIFNNCASSESGSSIYSDSAKFSFQSSTISFDIDHHQQQIKCRGIQINSKSDVILSDSHFYNCQSSGEGGGLKIDMTKGTNVESLFIHSCTFENSGALNGCSMYVKMNVEPTLEKIIIKNCTKGTYILTIIFMTYVEIARIKESVFEFNEFKNNAFPPLSDGGGSGIWISNQGLIYDDKLKYLIFEDCIWNQNQVKETSSLKYGGGFALGTSSTTKNTELKFHNCKFIQNKASEKGGALYLSTTNQVFISNCLFDGNEALEGSSIYFETTSNVTIEYTQITRGKGKQNGAVFINSNEILYLKNVTFSDNDGFSSPNSLYLHNEGKATIENCNFDLNPVYESNIYAIHLAGEASSASIDFKSNCFTHKGDIFKSSFYIYINHKGQINIFSGNCFDLSQSTSLVNQGGGSISIDSSVFNCHSCSPIYVPTLAPDSTPSQSPIATNEIGSQTVSNEPTYSSSIEPDFSNKKKKLSTKTIAMIAGISAAVVVLIIVIIFLLWIFVFRKKSAKSEKDVDENASEMNDEQIIEFNGNDQDDADPIWTGTNNDNHLFDGDNKGDENDDQMINNDFEESWGVI